MAEKFKYMPSLPLSYERQGEIFFTCRNFERLTQEEQAQVEEICAIAAAGDGYKRHAILAFMTTKMSWRECCMKHYISDSTLERLRRRFYELWEEMM